MKARRPAGHPDRPPGFAEGDGDSAKPKGPRHLEQTVCTPGPPPL